MLGAITGDIIGSAYEWNNVLSKNFELFSKRSTFTDDSVLTIALADAILNDRDYGEVMKEYYRRYPLSGFGGMFKQWASSSISKPYNSWGNGSAMRTSVVGYAYTTLDEVLSNAKFFASYTHNHPEGIKGAQAVSSAIYLARNGASKDEINLYISREFQYDLARSIDEIRPNYKFDVSCQGSVPEAIIAFLESEGYEDSIRNAISIGGDSDTIACIAGGIAEAFYGEIPSSLRTKALEILPEELRSIVDMFYLRTVNA